MVLQILRSWGGILLQDSRGEGPHLLLRLGCAAERGATCFADGDRLRVVRTTLIASLVLGLAACSSDPATKETTPEPSPPDTTYYDAPCVAHRPMPRLAGKA
jgi:hypothetical protein